MTSERLKVLFVCGRNQKRSPTAAALFQNDPRLNVRSGGVSGSSRHQVSRADMEWADLVLVMERKYAQRLSISFPNVGTEIHSLEIPDDYEFMDSELVERLRESVEEALEIFAEDAGWKES